MNHSLVSKECASAVQVYGETSVGKESGCTETSTLEPTNPYSAAKAGAGGNVIPPMSSRIPPTEAQHSVQCPQYKEWTPVDVECMHEQGSQRLTEA